MIALILQDPCSTVAPGSFLWYAMGCWMPFSALHLGAVAVLTYGAVRLVRRKVAL